MYRGGRVNGVIPCMENWEGPIAVIPCLESEEEMGERRYLSYFLIIVQLSIFYEEQGLTVHRCEARQTEINIITNTTSKKM